MKTSEPKPEEILKKYTFGYPAKLWADDAEIAMQEYAEIYHKEKLREELKAFNSFVIKLSEEGKIWLIDTYVDEYLKTIE